jgi:hypothetical protein
MTSSTFLSSMLRGAKHIFPCNREHTRSNLLTPLFSLIRSDPCWGYESRLENSEHAEALGDLKCSDDAPLDLLAALSGVIAIRAVFPA